MRELASGTNFSSDLTHLILKVTTAQVVETSVTINSLSKDYPQLDDHKHITDTPGFKPFTMIVHVACLNLVYTLKPWLKGRRRKFSKSELVYGLGMGDQTDSHVDSQQVHASRRK